MVFYIAHSLSLFTVCLRLVQIYCHLVLLLLMVHVISSLVSPWSLLTLSILLFFFSLPHSLSLSHSRSSPSSPLPPSTPEDDRTPWIVNNSLISALHGA